jgi:hypothetical protein
LYLGQPAHAAPLQDPHDATVSLDEFGLQETESERCGRYASGRVFLTTGRTRKLSRFKDPGLGIAYRVRVQPGQSDPIADRLDFRIDGAKPIEHTTSRIGTSVLMREVSAF